MSIDTVHDPADIEALGNTLARTVSQRLGIMISDTEVDAILTDLEAHGYTLTTLALEDPTLEPATNTAEGNVQVHVHINATDDTVNARTAILNAREALTLTLP